MIHSLEPIHPKSKKASAGFTLIELIVVVAVAGVMLAVAIPMTMNQMRQRGIRDAAIQLSMDLQRAKLLAIQRDTNCSITFDAPVANQYTISISGEVVDLGKYPGGVAFTAASAPVITFTPQGLCQAFGSVFLTDQQRTFRVRATVSGGISVNEFAGGKWI